MPVRWMQPSPIVGIERFDSFDEFEPTDVIGGGTSRPLQADGFFAVRAILPLPDSLLVLQRSFPRQLEANLGSDRGVALAIPIAYHATVNGRPVDNTHLAFVRGKTPVRVVEQHPNTYLMLRLNSDMWDSGWPEFDTGLRLMNPDPFRLQRLRATVLDIFCWASACTCPDEFMSLGQAMQEMLFAALDNVLVGDSTRTARPGSFDRYQRLIRQLDELAACSPTHRWSNPDLAKLLGVSVRTLQSAANTVHGVNLHQYLRLKRLWSVRQQLTTGCSAVTIRSTAQASGFWHMSEFTRAYKFAFGELPSQTLARSRRL